MEGDKTYVSAEYMLAFAEVEANAIDRIIAENQRTRLELAKQDYATRLKESGDNK